MKGMTTMTMMMIMVMVTMMMTVGVRGHAGHHGNGMQMNQAPDRFDSSVVGDQDHMKEHLREEIGDIKKDMSPEEMEFHYFRLHDTNNDTCLDGLEIMKALVHMMPPIDVLPHEAQGKTPPEIENMRKDKVYQMVTGFTMLIDKVLETDDVDKDGYLTYPEYIVARRRDSKQMMKAQQEMLRQAKAYKDQQGVQQNTNY